MADENCIFCKIIKGEIPSFKVYEDDDFLAILDINPASKGHTLLMPKKHYAIMPQMPNDLIEKMGVAVKKISNVMIKMLGARGTLIYVANGGGAGQVAPHFILHIVPKYGGEEPLIRDDEAKKIELNDFREASNVIRDAIFKVLGVNQSETVPKNKNDSGEVESEKKAPDKQNESNESKNEIKENNTPHNAVNNETHIDVDGIDFNKIDKMFKGDL